MIFDNLSKMPFIIPCHHQLIFGFIWCYHILFIPNGVPAYKALEGRVTGKEHRYAMVQRLIAEESWCELSGMECEREGNTYTADTLLELTGENPDIQYELIVGSDSLKEMKHWYHPEIIFRLAGVIVLLRNQDTAETLVQTVKRYETEYGAQIRFVPFEKQEISSTLIRRKVKNGERLTGLVPEGVEQYIAEHRLYRSVSYTHLTLPTKLEV